MTARLHCEAPGAGNRHRRRMLAEVQALVRSRQRAADRRRREFFTPDFSSLRAYEASVRPYRKRLIELLGWPLTESAPKSVPLAKWLPVASDDLGSIHRVWIPTLPRVQTYGLFFRPPGRGPFPLAIVQHGGAGTPELCAGFFGSANYNDMLRRVLRRGIAVFAPQLLLWGKGDYGDDPGRLELDRRLKQTGGSLAALELVRLRRVLDYFSARAEIAADRIGMVGLSYGGFYTLYAAALDRRIRVAVSSCFFNDRYRYDLGDWVWFDAANHLLDVEVGALVCPRPLYIEVGRRDELFDARHARPLARQLAAIYRRLGIGERFRFHEHPGGHEFARDDGGIEFLARHLMAG